MGMSLRAARYNARLNQQEAADGLGIAVETLANYESGKSYPRVPVIKKMEKLYGVSYNDLDFLPSDDGETVTRGNR